MANEVRELDRLVDQIQAAKAHPDIQVVAMFICPICKRYYAKLAECLEGIDYIPPDPMPLGECFRDLALDRSGVVTENNIVSSSRAHQHERRITFQPDGGGGRSWIYIREGYDSGSDRFVPESEWKALQQGEGGE